MHFNNSVFYYSTVVLLSVIIIAPCTYATSTATGMAMVACTWGASFATTAPLPPSATMRMPSRGRHRHLANLRVTGGIRPYAPVTALCPLSR